MDDFGSNFRTTLLRLTTAFLTWPMPPGAPTVRQGFIRWLRNERMEPIERMSDVLGEKKVMMGVPNDGLLVGLLISVNNGVNLGWTEPELLAAANKIRDWWNTEGQRLVTLATTEQAKNTVREVLGPRLRLLAHVIHRVFSERISLETVCEHKFDKWFKELWDAGVAIDSPLVALLFGCLRWWPEQEASVLTTALNTLESSSDRHVVVGALSAASLWTKQSIHPTAGTRRYMAYLFDALRGGQESLLESKLDAISEILEHVKPIHFQYHLSSLAIVLYSFLDDLQKAKARGSARYNPYANPLLRVAVVEALVAMRPFLDGRAPEPTWLAAMELARKDPLLIVRKLAF